MAPWPVQGACQQSGTLRNSRTPGSVTHAAGAFVSPGPTQCLHGIPRQGWNRVELFAVRRPHAPATKHVRPPRILGGLCAAQPRLKLLYSMWYIKVSTYLFWLIMGIYVTPAVVMTVRCFTFAPAIPPRGRANRRKAPGSPWGLPV